MNESIDITRWSEYQETPCRTQAPVKLAEILEQRIEAFLRAKKIKAAQSLGDKRGR